MASIHTAVIQTETSFHKEFTKSSSGFSLSRLKDENAALSISLFQVGRISPDQKIRRGF